MSELCGELPNLKVLTLQQFYFNILRVLIRTLYDALILNFDFYFNSDNFLKVCDLFKRPSILKYENMPD